jgi:hypothetical protein
MDKIYFCGGSLGAIYYIGVIRALYERNIDVKTVYGNSAGAFFGLVFHLKMTVGEIEELLQTAVVQHIQTKVLLRPWELSSFQMSEPCFRVFREIHRKYPKAYKQCRKRLHIGTFQKGTGFVWQSDFSSNEELFNAVLCSSNIPFVCNYNAFKNGSPCLDGCIGMSSSYLPEDVLTIGASNTDCIINARLSLFHCFVPLPYELYDGLKRRGYKDISKYLENPSDFSNTSNSNYSGIAEPIQWLSDIQKLYFHMYSYSDMCEFIRTT